MAQPSEVKVTILWALFGTIGLALIGIRLPGLEFQNQMVEAAFRKDGGKGVRSIYHLMFPGFLSFPILILRHSEPLILPPLLFFCSLFSVFDPHALRRLEELVYGEDDERHAEPDVVKSLFGAVRDSYFRLYFNFMYFDVAKQLATKPYTTSAKWVISDCLAWI